MRLTRLVSFSLDSKFSDGEQSAKRLVVIFQLIVYYDTNNDQVVGLDFHSGGSSVGSVGSTATGGSVTNETLTGQASSFLGNLQFSVRNDKTVEVSAWFFGESTKRFFRLFMSGPNYRKF